MVLYPVLFNSFHQSKIIIQMTHSGYSRYSDNGSVFDTDWESTTATCIILQGKQPILFQCFTGGFKLIENTKGAFLYRIYGIALSSQPLLMEFSGTIGQKAKYHNMVNFNFHGQWPIHLFTRLDNFMPHFPSILVGKRSKLIGFFILNTGLQCISTQFYLSFHICCFIVHQLQLFIVINALLISDILIEYSLFLNQECFDTKGIYRERNGVYIFC